jgi:hypothetical protein
MSADAINAESAPGEVLARLARARAEVIGRTFLVALDQILADARAEAVAAHAKTYAPAAPKRLAVLTDPAPDVVVLVDVLSERHGPRWVNDRGRVVGGDHPSAVLSDDDVRLVRELHLEGMKARDIARKFGVSIHTVYSVVQGRRRTAFPVRQKTFAKPRTRRKAPRTESQERAAHSQP